MTPVPISKTKIETKLAIMRESLLELQQIAKISKEDFLRDKRNYAVAEHYLRRALEAVFDISGHIASRYPMSPGKRPSTYKDLALFMGEKKIVENPFSEKVLTAMAGYRNRLVHFYDEISPEELYTILHEKLPNIETFAEAVVAVLKNPSRFGLSVADN